MLTTSSVLPRPLAGRATIAGLALALLLAAAASAQEPRSTRLEEYLEARAALGQFNGTVLVAEGGEVLIHDGFGFADFELRGPATQDTRYRVASISKQFTAMAVLLLQEDGLLSVDDPVSAHVPELPEMWADITIHQLLRHTSGIPDYEEWFDGYTTAAYSDYMSQRHAPDRILEDAKQKPLDFAPGSEFHYSNTGYVLLGFLVETVSRRSYQEFLDERIFAPLGMSYSSQDHSAQILADRAKGYALRPGALDGPYFNGMTIGDFRNANDQYMSPPQGDAGLITTSGDLYRWDRALYSNELISSEAREAIFTPGLGDYGYGWRIQQGDHGRVYRHSGGLPGFACQIVRFPDEDAVIIVLSNVQTLPGWIVRDLTAILFGEPYALPEARRIVGYDSTLHGGYEGTYRGADGDSLRVYFDGLPLVEWEGHFTAGLFPETSSQFYVALIEGGARFARRPDGSVELVITDRFGAELVRAVRSPGSTGGDGGERAGSAGAARTGSRAAMTTIP